MQTKICTKCKQEKCVDRFHKDSAKKDDLCCSCKECCAEEAKNYRQKNKKKIKELSQKYYQKNKEKIIKNCQERYRKNPDGVKDRTLNWYCRRCENHPYLAWVEMTIRNHQRRGFLIDININDLKLKAEQTSFCLLCGCELDWRPNKGKLTPASPSLDRINNEKIINLGNTIIICHECNSSKRSKTFKELKDWCRKIIKISESELIKGVKL